MKAFIFLSEEGFTFLPKSESSDPDVENLQVIGFAIGDNEKEAFDNLVSDNRWLLDASFDGLICFELKNINYWNSVKYFQLTEDITHY